MADLPYGRHHIDDADIAAVTDVLRSDWLTTGPMVARFEEAVARLCGVAHGVAVSNGTAALHVALAGIGVGPGDEVLVPALTFVATANAALYCGAKPVFVDVDPDTLLMDPEDAKRKAGDATRAIVPVDFAGQPCDVGPLGAVADDVGASIVVDACHSLGGQREGRQVGTMGRATCLSFHPVKHITTGEGGMIVTDDADLAAHMRRLRSHGIDRDHQSRARAATHAYDMVELGFNYRLTDFQCALGLSQLRHLDAWLARRRALAAHYDAALADVEGVRPLSSLPGHAYHLYVVRIADGRRDAVFAALREQGIGVAVHYPATHLHSHYRRTFGTRDGQCPVAEAAAKQIMSLPLHPGMTEDDVDRVVAAVRAAQ